MRMEKKTEQRSKENNNNNNNREIWFVSHDKAMIVSNRDRRNFVVVCNNTRVLAILNKFRIGLTCDGVLSKRLNRWWLIQLPISQPGDTQNTSQCRIPFCNDVERHIGEIIYQNVCTDAASNEQAAAIYCAVTAIWKELLFVDEVCVKARSDGFESLASWW